MNVEAIALTRLSFWFLRHGETDWNVRGLSQGSTDIALNPTGVAQAHAAAALLGHRGIQAIVSSPLSRAHDTAKIAAAAIGVPVETDDDLREVAFGEQEGHPQTEWFADWIAGTYLPRGAETFSQLRNRAVAAVNRAVARPAPVLVVGHGALFRGLRAEMGLEANVRTPNATPFFCEPGVPGWTLTPLRG